MIDPNEHEIAAMMVASDRGGEFIEELGKTDMAKWSQDQWMQFVEVVCGGYVDALCEQQAGINAAMSKVSGRADGSPPL